ncbi:hypothetical protein [Achromobacter sp. Marseille-Q4962]|uniref:hypothetical protein n=1 Tax=Achromobacter sp. Marseille-Q4962 TaxID=2942202 RepID=UPI0020745B9D|nr:hypothetical protein [Achromobacter sp. Marseille-Q4962]
MIAALGIMTNHNNAAQAAEQDPINAAILILTEEADTLSDCHTRTIGDWAGEDEVKARYDHIRAIIAALSKLRAPVADERAAFENRFPSARNDLVTHGVYLHQRNQDRWEAWQARAALAATKGESNE